MTGTLMPVIPPSYQVLLMGYLNFSACIKKNVKIIWTKGDKFIK